MAKPLEHRHDRECLLKDVGVAEFNKQHLLAASYAVDFQRMVEEIGERDLTPDEWRHVDAVTQRLQRYVVFHFDSEEALMVQHGYPGYAEQKRQHDSFRQQFMTVELEIRGRKAGALQRMDQLVWSWLFAHINGSDFDYREFFLEKLA